MNTNSMYQNIATGYSQYNKDVKDELSQLESLNVDVELRTQDTLNN